MEFKAIKIRLNPNEDRNKRPEYKPGFKKREKKDHIDKLKHLEILYREIFFGFLT